MPKQLLIWSRNSSPWWHTDVHSLIPAVTGSSSSISLQEFEKFLLLFFYHNTTRLKMLPFLNKNKHITFFQQVCLHIISHSKFCVVFRAGLLAFAVNSFDHQVACFPPQSANWGKKTVVWLSENVTQTGVPEKIQLKTFVPKKMIQHKQALSELQCWCYCFWQKCAKRPSGSQAHFSGSRIIVLWK